VNHAPAAVLHCRIQPSRRLRVFSIFVHITALAVVVTLAWHRPWLWLLLPPIAVSHYLCSRRVRLASPASIHALRWEGTSPELEWYCRDGRIVRGQLVSALTLGGHTVVLRLRPANRRLATSALCLPADSLDPDTHRRLRVRLTVCNL